MADGSISQLARAQIPGTWDALARSSTYGEPALSGIVDFVKFDLFATVVDQGLEATVYNPVVRMYAGKLAALQVIPAGADHFKDQSIQVTLGSQRQDSKTLIDRTEALWKQYDRLSKEVAAMWPQIEGIIGVKPKRLIALPTLSGAGLLTPDPATFTPLAATCAGLPYTVGSWA